MKFEIGDRVRFLAPSTLRKKFKGKSSKDRIEFVKENPIVTIEDICDGEYGIEEDQPYPSWWPEGFFKCRVNESKFKEGVVPKFSKLSSPVGLTDTPTFSSLSCGEIDAPISSLVLKESDPTGKQVGEPGAKLDKGKPKASLLRHFSRALLKIAEVGTFGVDVKGYARGGWQDVENGIERYDDAKWRHLLKESIQFADDDCDIGHTAQEAWNTLSRLELILREEEKKNADTRKS